MAFYVAAAAPITNERTNECDFAARNDSDNYASKRLHVDSTRSDGIGSDFSFISEKRQQSITASIIHQNSIKISTWLWIASGERFRELHLQNLSEYQSGPASSPLRSTLALHDLKHEPLEKP